MTAAETPVDIEFEYMGNFFTTTPLTTTTQVSFPAGVVLSTAKITISTVDDKDIEADGSLVASIDIIPGSPLRPGTPDERIVTILNDDVPAVISFERPGYVIFEDTTDTITLRADPRPGIKTQIELTTDSATILNSEFSLSTTIVVFEPDQSTASFEVSIFDDGIARSTRELSLSINPLDENSIPGTVSETVISVVDNDVLNASLEIVRGNIRPEEGERVTLRVTLDAVFDRAVTIQIVNSGTATTEDYRISSNMVRLSAGSTFVERTLLVIDDTLVEPDETIIFTLEADNKQIITDDESSVTLTIADNDVPTIEFEPARYVILEGTTVTITLVADQRPVVRTRIELTTDSETILNSEFRLSTTIVVFEPDQSTASFEVSISVRDDFQETRELRLSFSPLDDNSTPGTVSVAVISVEDNGVPIASLEVVGDAIVLEEGGSATLQVTLDRSFEQATSIRIVTTGEGTATTEDYRINGNLVELRAGSTFVETTLLVIEDDLVEPDETIILVLEAHNERIIDTLPGAQLTLTIADNDVPAISFDPSDYDIPEGTTGKVTLVTDQPPVVETAIELTTRSGTTVSDADYELSTTTVVFKPGQSTASFVVEIIDDSVVQSDRKLYLSFVPDKNSTPGEDSVAMITIEDNEPVISLRAPGQTGCQPSTSNCRIVVTEGEVARLQLDASRLTATTLTVNLRYTVDPGALTGEPTSANTPNIDTTVTVAINTISRTFEVGVTEDRIAAEFTRAAHVVLQEGDGYTVDPDNTTVEVAVMDNDFAEVYFSQSAGSVTEGEDIVFIIIKDLITNRDESVDISVVEFTGDFFKTTPMRTQVSFPAGGVALSTAKITIPTVDDKDIEADGSLMAKIVIIPGSALRPGDGDRPNVRTVTILDNDVPAISFEPAKYTIFEGTTGTITLRAEPPPLVKIQIELTTLMETTIPENEYRLSTTIVTFEPSQSTASFEVSIPAKAGFQETVRKLHLSFDLLNPENSTPGAVSVAVINVEDDSAPIASLEIVEGDSGLEERDSDSVTLRVRLDRVFDQETSYTDRNRRYRNPG